MYSIELMSFETSVGKYQLPDFKGQKKGYIRTVF